MVRPASQRLKDLVTTNPGGPFAEGAFTSRLHSRRTAAWLGMALGVTFGICFLTGLISHAIQMPPAWFTWPSRPVSLFRLTQGLHIATGLATFPILLAKLWTVYPHFWTWPAARGVAHALERAALFPLVAGSAFLLWSGLSNIGLWYPFAFFFPTAHYYAAWLTIGAMLVHIAAKAPVIREALSRRSSDLDEPAGDGLSRRGFLGTVAAAAGLITLVTAGQTVWPLRRLALLAPRRPDIGPQGFPVNKSAKSAKVLVTATSPLYALTITGAGATPVTLTLADLQSMEQVTETLPIACVEGWSTVQTWTGVRVRDLLDLAGAPRRAKVRVESLQVGGLYRTSVLNRKHARDAKTLLALRVNGEPLHLEHGYPLRLIGPNRPGVQQTKWVSSLVVLA